MPKRVDDNQKDIVKDLIAVGASVQSLANIGKGCVDLLVGFRKKNYLFEVKNPNQPPSKRELTDDEKEWHSSWRGDAHVILTSQDAINIMMKG